MVRSGAMSGMKIPKNLKGGKMPNMHMDVNQMSRMLPPHMLQMMGGPPRALTLTLPLTVRPTSAT